MLDDKSITADALHDAIEEIYNLDDTYDFINDTYIIPIYKDLKKNKEKSRYLHKSKKSDHVKALNNFFDLLELAAKDRTDLLTYKDISGSNALMVAADLCLDFLIADIIAACEKANILQQCVSTKCNAGNTAFEIIFDNNISLSAQTLNKLIPNNSNQITMSNGLSIKAFVLFRFSNIKILRDKNFQKLPDPQAESILLYKYFTHLGNNLLSSFKFKFNNIDSISIDPEGITTSLLMHKINLETRNFFENYKNKFRGTIKNSIEIIKQQLENIVSTNHYNRKKFSQQIINNISKNGIQSIFNEHDEHVVVEVLTKDKYYYANQGYGTKNNGFIKSLKICKQTNLKDIVKSFLNIKTSHKKHFQAVAKSLNSTLDKEIILPLQQIGNCAFKAYELLMRILIIEANESSDRDKQITKNVANDFIKQWRKFMFSKIVNDFELGLEKKIYPFNWEELCLAIYINHDAYDAGNEIYRLIYLLKKYSSLTNEQLEAKLSDQLKKDNGDLYIEMYQKHFKQYLTEYTVNDKNNDNLIAKSLVSLSDHKFDQESMYDLVDDKALIFQITPKKNRVKKRALDTNEQNNNKKVHNARKVLFI